MNLIPFLSRFLKIVYCILNFLSSQELKREGAEEQSLKESNKSEIVQKEIAQQEANEDKSKESLINSAKKGEF